MDFLFLCLIIGQFWYINYRLKQAEKKFQINYQHWKEELTAIEDTVVALLSQLEESAENIKSDLMNEKQEVLHACEPGKSDISSIFDSVTEHSPTVENKRNSIIDYVQKGFSKDEIARILGLGLGEIELCLNLASKEEGNDR